MCEHTFTRGREGQKGSWCVDCGEKIYDVDPRECGACKAFRRLWDGSICTKHLMGVVPDMHVNYRVEDGSCWEERV